MKRRERFAVTSRSNPRLQQPHHQQQQQHQQQPQQHRTHLIRSPGQLLFQISMQMASVVWLETLLLFWVSKNIAFWRFFHLLCVRWRGHDAWWVPLGRPPKKKEEWRKSSLELRGNSAQQMVREGWFMWYKWGGFIPGTSSLRLTADLRWTLSGLESGELWMRTSLLQQ